MSSAIQSLWETVGSVGDRSLTKMRRFPLNFLSVAWTACMVLRVACSALPCWAQSERSAPATVRVGMKAGGISLRFLALPSGAEGIQIWAHLYAVPPRGQAPEGTPKGTPFTKAYIVEGNILPTPFTFYLDLFTQKAGSTSPGKGLERRATILFQQNIYPREIGVRWREPDKKRGLVLMLNFQIGNSGVWQIISLDDRLQPVARQEFWFAFDTAEPDYRTDVITSERDTRGFLKIGAFTSEGEKQQTIWYEWNGSAFIDSSASYFVVVTTCKTRREAEYFIAWQQLQEYEIISTSDYKRLSPRLYAVVIKRFRDIKQAEGYAQSWNASGKRYQNYTVLQAF